MKKIVLNKWWSSNLAYILFAVLASWLICENLAVWYWHSNLLILAFFAIPLGISITLLIFKQRADK